MLWFKSTPKAPKMPLQLFEEELIRLHNWARSTDSGYMEARAMIQEMNKVIRNAGAQDLNKDLDAKLKSIEDAISDLYLVGKSDGKS